MACFSEGGTKADFNDALIIAVIKGIISSMHDFNSQVGSGSNSHEVDFDFLMILATSDSVHGSNSESGI